MTNVLPGDFSQEETSSIGDLCSFAQNLPASPDYSSLTEEETLTVLVRPCETSAVLSPTPSVPGTVTQVQNASLHLVSQRPFVDFMGAGNDSTSRNRPVRARHSQIGREAPRTEPLNNLPLRNRRQHIPTGGHENVNNAHNIQNTPRYRSPEAGQPVPQSTPPAIPTVTNQNDMPSSNGDPVPSAMANWFKGTWEDRNYKMRPSNEVRMPLSFRQHSARTTQETLPKSTRIGMEGKGDQFGFQLRPSFVAFYDGKWIANDKKIAHCTEEFTEKIDGKRQTILGFKEFAKALSDETRLRTLGIDKDGIFALLVASGDETTVRVRMTENSPVALRVLRPVRKGYEIILSSESGELRSCLVEEYDVVIVGQSNEMGLLDKLEVMDLSKLLLDQLPEDRFWTVSILLAQQNTPTNRLNVVGNAHNIQNTAQHGQNERQEARQSESQSTSPATSTIIDQNEMPSPDGDNEPFATKDWFRGTWESINSKMSVSKKTKLPLSFRKHSVQVTREARTKHGRIGMEGKGDLFGFQLKPSFVAFYDGNWITNDRKISHNTKEFTEKIDGKRQTISSCQRFAKALSDETRLKKLGIDKDGIFALLVASGDETTIRVRMTDDSPVALKVLRPVGRGYETILSSIPGELVSRPVKRNDVVVMGQRSEMRLLDNLMIKSLPELLLAQLSDDHFWAVSILLGQQATPADEAIETNISPPAATHIDSSSSAQTTATGHSTDLVDSRIAQNLQLSLQDIPTSQLAVNNGSIINQHPAPPLERQQIMPTDRTIRMNIPPPVTLCNHPHVSPPAATLSTNRNATRYPIAQPVHFSLQDNRPIRDIPSSQSVVNNGSVISQPLAPPSEQVNSSAKVDWFHGPARARSNRVNKAAKTWPFSFKRQFILVPSDIKVGSVTSSGFTGISDRFSFTMRLGFIVLAEGRWEGLPGSGFYTKSLVKAVKTSELESKNAFDIRQSGLCAILEKDKDGIRMHLHVQVIGKLPVTLKVMRRIEDSWVAISASEESGTLTSYEIMAKDIIIIGESVEMETGQNLPIESHDLFGSLEKIEKSQFRFLLLAQLTT